MHHSRFEKKTRLQMDNLHNFTIAIQSRVQPPLHPLLFCVLAYSYQPKQTLLPHPWPKHNPLDFFHHAICAQTKVCFHKKICIALAENYRIRQLLDISLGLQLVGVRGPQKSMLYHYVGAKYFFRLQLHHKAAPDKLPQHVSLYPEIHLRHTDSARVENTLGLEPGVSSCLLTNVFQTQGRKERNRIWDSYLRLSGGGSNLIKRVPMMERLPGRMSTIEH